MFKPLNTEAYFIDLKFELCSKDLSVLKFKIDHLGINLCLPYILQLYQFAMDAINSTTSKETGDAAKTAAASIVVDTAVKKKTPATPTMTMETNPLAKTENTAVLKVFAEMRFPEIILFAEPEKIDSKILFLSVRK